MSKNKMFEEYMAFIHVTTVETNDFDELERLVMYEDSLYKGALKDAYALEGVLFTKKREKALQMIDDAHKNFVEKAKNIIEAYVSMYGKVTEEWHTIMPKYRWDIKEYDWNVNEFHRFCQTFASRFGTWFYSIQLRHDPLDDMSWGEPSTIAQLQSEIDKNLPWYPWMEDWLCIPYGARLLKYYMDGGVDWHGDHAWIDLTMMIIRNRGLYKNKPSKKLRDLLKYDEK